MVATSVDQATGLLALGGAGGVAIVDPTTSDVAVVLGVDNAVSVGFVRDGELLVIVEQDGTVRLWDVARGESIGVLWAGLGSASASPPWYDATTDSVWVATSGKLLRFPLDPDRWVEKACELVGRSLTQDEWTSYVPGDGPPQSACA